MLTSLKQICSGFIVGIANIIPGVSGGTLLFILGLYERTLGALGNFNMAALRALAGHAWGAAFSRRRKERLSQFVKQANVLDIPFLIKIVLGAGIAILTLSSLMEYLLENHFANTYALFFGLIVVSAVMCVKMLKVKKPLYIIHLILGAAVTVALTASVDPAISAGIKSERYRLELEAKESAELADIIAKVMADRSDGAPDTSAATMSTESPEPHGTGAMIASTGPEEPDESYIRPKETNAAQATARMKYTGQYSPAELIYAAAAGAVAISAMILPGLSGSLVLILMGQYQEVISAISGMKTLQLDYFVFLTIMSLGMITGILAFARLISFVYKRFYNGTVAFLIGLTFGSLYALWPFKLAVTTDLYVKTSGNVTLIENAVIQSNINIMPSDIAPAILAAACCLAGAGIMLALDRKNLKTKAKD